MTAERKIPKFITENEDGTYTVLAKGKEYVLEELDGEGLEKAKTVASNLKTVSEDAMIAARSLKSPEMSDSDFLKLPGSIYAKLIAATAYVYEFDDFLD